MKVVRIALCLTCLALMGAALPAPAGADTAYRGVQLHSLWSDSTNAELDRDLDLTAQAGANVVRVDVAWSSLETEGKGRLSQWYVDKLDRFVSGARARGIKVIATLWSTPCWASTAPERLEQGCRGRWWERDVTSYPPRDAADYADAARWLTARYGTGLAALEVWNEPNRDESIFFRPSGDRAAAYAALVRAAYPAAKAGNAEVPVLIGSMSFSDRPFLERLYAQGVDGCYEGISVHPYNEWRAPGDLWQDEYKMYALLPGLAWLHDAQLRHGDTTPLWITELGWTTAEGERWGVSEQQQGEFVRDVWPLLAGLDYVRAATIYNLREKGDDPRDFEHNFGLVNADFSPKPGYRGLSEGLGGRRAGAAAADTEPPPVRATRTTGRGVSLSLSRTGEAVVAAGRAQAGGKVRVAVTGCGRATARRTTRASKTGRYRVAVGRADVLRGALVTASAAGRGAASAPVR